jgi:hypothetical protein
VAQETETKRITTTEGETEAEALPAPSAETVNTFQFPISEKARETEAAVVARELKRPYRRSDFLADLHRVTRRVEPNQD